MLSNFSPEFVVTRCWREVLIPMLTLKLPRRSQYQSKKIGVWTPMARLWAPLQIDFWDITLWVGTTSSIQVGITKLWFSRLEQAGFNVKSSSKQLWAAPWRLHDQYYRPEERVLQEILLSWTTFFLATYVYTNYLRTQARRKIKELFLWAGSYEQNRYMMNAVSANRGPTLQCLSTRIRSTKPSGSHLQLFLHEEVAQRLGIFIWGLQGVNHNNCAQICDPSGSRLEYPSLLQNRSRRLTAEGKGYKLCNCGVSQWRSYTQEIRGKKERCFMKGRHPWAQTSCAAEEYDQAAITTAKKESSKNRAHSICIISHLSKSKRPFSGRLRGKPWAKGCE